LFYRRRKADLEIKASPQMLPPPYVLENIDVETCANLSEKINHERMKKIKDINFKYLEDVINLETMRVTPDGLNLESDKSKTFQIRINESEMSAHEIFVQ
jgi:hypothetical protein